MVEDNSLYQIQFSRKAQKDIRELTEPQKRKLKQIFKEVVRVNPFTGKALKGKLKGLYSLRLNRQDRILYEIYEQDKTVLIIRARTHYGE